MAIIDFEQDLEYYFHTACEFNDNGDFVKCLEYLHNAFKMAQKEYNAHKHKSEDSICNLYSIKSEIAATYCDMELYGESIKQYYKMYDCPAEFKDELFFGLVKNYAMLDMVPQAAHYLNLGIELGYLDPGDGNIKAELLNSDLEYKPFTLVTKTKDDYSINLAKQLMATSQDNKYAKQILQSVSEDNCNYIDALAMLSILELSEDNGVKALGYANKAMAVNPDNINAICVKIMALGFVEDKSELSKTIDALEKIEISSLEDATRAVTAMANINNNKLALKYADICLKYIPYDRDMGLIRALALANLGNKVDSMSQLVNLQIIFPDDIELKFFARKVVSATGKTNFPLFGMNKNESEYRIIDAVYDFINENDTSRKIAANLKKNPEMFEKIKFAFQSDDYQLVDLLSGIVAGFYELDEFVRTKLIDPDYPLICKKIILHNVLLFSDNKNFLLVSNNIIHEFNPQLPLCMYRPNSDDAYWLVYSALAFVETDFDKKLNSTCKNLAKNFESLLAFEPSVQAALIAYKSKCSKIFAQKEHCAEIFNCELSELNRLIDLIKFKKMMYKEMD